MISARYVEARLTTLANLTTPVMTLVLAFLLLSDWPQPNELLGGAIMMVGIAVPLLRSAQDALEER
jgi:drug/metabolite transporter (DMT)-like permease